MSTELTIAQRKTLRIALLSYAFGVVIGFAAAHFFKPQTVVYHIHTALGHVIKTDSLTQLGNRGF